MIFDDKSIIGNVFHKRNILVEVALMGFSVLFLAVLSNIRINMWPVPITLQTLGVFVIAFFFGSRAVFSVLLYILAGIAGLGVFTGYGSGIGSVLGPTGGYLIGFLACAYIVGRMVETGHNEKNSLMAAMGVGNIVIYIFGGVGLYIYLNSLGSASVLEVVSSGILPFIVGDLLKIYLASRILYLFIPSQSQ